MRTCSVKPSSGECNMCMDTADLFDGNINCSECGYRKQRYKLIEIVSGIFNDYAFVESNGRILKVSLDRIFDVKEENGNV